MAVLSDEDRYSIWGRFMSDISNRREAVNVNKPQLRAAVDAIDTWISDNTASFKAAIPEPAKTELSNKYKVELFMRIANRRWEVS